jgi:hypothetical protein
MDQNIWVSTLNFIEISSFYQNFRSSLSPDPGRQNGQQSKKKEKKARKRNFITVREFKY